MNSSSIDVGENDYPRLQIFGEGGFSALDMEAHMHIRALTVQYISVDRLCALGIAQKLLRLPVITALLRANYRY